METKAQHNRFNHSIPVTPVAAADRRTGAFGKRPKRVALCDERALLELICNDNHVCPVQTVYTKMTVREP